MISLSSLSNVVTNIYSKKSIQAAGGYAKVSTIYDSISGCSPTVAVGWNNYSEIVMDYNNARDVRYVTESDDFYLVKEITI